MKKRYRVTMDIEVFAEDPLTAAHVADELLFTHQFFDSSNYDVSELDGYTAEETGPRWHVNLWESNPVAEPYTDDEE